MVAANSGLITGGRKKTTRVKRGGIWGEVNSKLGWGGGDF